MYSLDSFSYLEPVCCSMSSSKCCFLTCIQISQETGQVIWYSHLLKNFLQFVAANCWSFSFSISPFSDYSGLISLKIDWFDLPAVQGTFRSLFQHHSSKALVIWCSAFLTLQLSQLYVTNDDMGLCRQSNVSAFQHTV